MVLDAAEVSPWQRAPRRPPAALSARRSSRGDQGQPIVSAVINYRPKKMRGIWKCHRDDTMLSVSESLQAAAFGAFLSCKFYNLPTCAG